MAETKDINEVDLLYNLKNGLNVDKTFVNVFAIQLRLLHFFEI